MLKLLYQFVLNIFKQVNKLNLTKRESQNYSGNQNGFERFSKGKD